MEESNFKTIELKEEVEGDFAQTSDFFFDKIGCSIPLSSDVEFQFDLQSLPSRPLAVSERFQLIFVSHFSGFWVARTKDVVDSANAIKEKRDSASIQELSVVDVQIGKVHILSLSTDSSMLAASVGGDIHFYSVKSLLSKEQKPSFSCSLYDSTCVKDFHWIHKSANSFVVLSSQGGLYHGAFEPPLKDVMDNVDAIECSVGGNLVVVARKNTLSILSSTLKERFRLQLSIESWADASDENCIIKVDSIKWIRPDCIILGCLQLTAEDMEEKYMVQVITTKSGKFTDVSSDLIVLTFSDVFSCLIDDIVPYGSGPHLFLSYLDHWELAIAANRKNTDQHIVLIGWSKGDEDGKATVIDIDRDKWLPRIELQENDADNVVLGLCVDKVSVYGKVKIQLGVEEEKELTPYCVLFCLTLEGRLIMYHVASLSETADQTLVESIFLDKEEEDITPTMSHLESDVFKRASGSVGEVFGDVNVDVHLHDRNKKEICKEGNDEIPNKEDSKSFDRNYFLTPNVVLTGSQEVKTPANFQKFKAGEQKETHQLGPFQDKIGQQLQFSSWQNKESNQQLDLNISQQEETNNLAMNLGQSDARKNSEAGHHTDCFVGKSKNDISQQLDKDSQKDIEVGNDLPKKSGFISLQSGPSQAWSIGKSASLHDSDTRYTAPHSSSSANPLYSKDNTQSTSFNASTQRIQNGGGQVSSNGMGNIEPLPSIRSSQFKSSDEKFLNYKLPDTTEKYERQSLSRQPSAESKLSKRFGSIKDMTEELDALLECIEEVGGFRDASTAVHTSSLAALEQGMATLSEKCRMSKSILDERFKEVQNLLDKTVQVLARKVYIEGILKQANDSRYWDLWNRQKLSSELDLKRQHLIEINQDLTCRLIELERHFNTLELNKFGDDGGSYLGRKSQSRFEPSRHVQSLHSLHNTMNLQLEAAEQLSECLLKQMSVLSIKSPEKRKSVKDELFETIGIPYDYDSYSSPDLKKPHGTLLKTNISYPSSSVASKDQSMRKQLSLTKNNEPESARRRRDSLDMSWASFDPPKTTVKRSIVQKSQNLEANKSLFSMYRQTMPSDQERTVSSQANSQATTSSSTFLFPSVNKGIHDLVPNRARESSTTSLFKLTTKDLPAPTSQIVDPKFSISQRNNFPSRFSDSNDFTAPSPASSLNITTDKTGPSLMKDTKSMPPESGLFGAPSITTISASQALSTLNSKETMPITTKSLSFESDKSKESLFSGTSSTPAPKFSGNIFQDDSLKVKSQFNENVLPSISYSAPLPTSSVSPLTSASPPAPQFSFPSFSSTVPASLSKATTDANQTISSISTSSSSAAAATTTATIPAAASSIPSSGSFPIQAFEKLTPSFPSPPLTSALESPQTEVQSSVGKFNLKTDTIVAASSPFLQAQSSGTSPVSSVVSNTKPEPQLSFTNIGFQTVPSNSASAVLAEEDEMEEEASETSNTAEPNLGSFGGFGFGSNPAPTGPKTNPFGGSFGNTNTPVNTGNSPFTLTNPTGGLFRPASLSFQSPTPSQTPPQTVSNPFSGGFGMGGSGGSGFGQPSQIGSGGQRGFGQPSQIGSGGQQGFGQPSQMGPGQQALGSVLGGFGQSRQIGTGSPVNAFAPTSSFGGGFTQPTGGGGFAKAATGGGFAGAASGGGFAAAASGGGFAAAASGGGFAGAASSGGGFGAFNNQQGSGTGFSAFGNPGGGTANPPSSQLFTQMRK